MKIINQIVMTAVIVFSFAKAASAERLWEGHIHFVDCHLKLDFAGYGSNDMNALRHLEIKTGRPGDFHQAGFSFAPDDDTPFRATFRGSIRVVVDGWSAETKKLRLVRQTRYSKRWKVHPEDVTQLIKSSKRQNDRQSAM